MDSSFAPAALLGWWVAEDDKAVLIEHAARAGTSGSVLVSVFPSRRAEPYRAAWPNDDGTKRVERLDAIPCSRDGHYFLQVEAGLIGYGPTYELYPVVRSADGGWRQPDDITSRSARVDALVPNTRTGLYDEWEDDLGVPWASPLLPLLPVTG